MQDKIYPLISIRVATSKEALHSIVFLELKTILRKKSDNGKWYRWTIEKMFKFKFEDFTPDRSISALNEFHKLVYDSIIFGKVNINLLHSHTGEPVFKLDDYQGTEKERLNLDPIRNANKNRIPQISDKTG